MDYIQKTEDVLGAAERAVEDGRAADAQALGLAGVGYAILACGHAISAQLHGLRKALGDERDRGGEER